MIRIVITEAGAGVVNGLRGPISASGEAEIVGYARDGLEAAQLAMQLAPDVLVVHEELPEITGYKVASLIRAAAPDVGVLIVVNEESADCLRRAMAAGARAVVGAAAGPDKLLDAIRQVAASMEVRQEPEYPLVTDRELMPTSIAVTAAKGGSGKTTVAVNLAVAFANRYPDKVALVDCHAQFGDAAIALNITPHDSIADLACFDELDAELVQTHLSVHAPSTLRLLSAPDIPIDEGMDLGRITSPFLASLVGHLRRSFRFVFFDLPPLIWPTSSYVMSRCQQVIVVTDLIDLAAIRNTRSLLDLAEDCIGDADRVKLVVNRAGRKGDFGINDLRETTHREIYHQLPDAYEIASGAFNRGVPIVTEYASSPLGRSLLALGNQLNDEFAAITAGR